MVQVKNSMETHCDQEWVCENLKSLVVDDETIAARTLEWQALFDKYSNCNDTEEDAIDLDDLIDCSEDDDLAEDTDDCAEEEPIKRKPKSKQRQDTFALMTRDEQEANLVYYYSPELLNVMKKVVKNRMAELGKRNLPFWTIRQESFFENNSIMNVAVDTPEFRYRSNGMDRTVNIQSNTLMPMNASSMQLSRLNCSEYQAGDNSQGMLSQIKSMIDMKAKFTVNVTEREYSIEFLGGDDGNAETTLKAILEQKGMQKFRNDVDAAKKQYKKTLASKCTIGVSRKIKVNSSNLRKPFDKFISDEETDTELKTTPKKVKQKPKGSKATSSKAKTKLKLYSKFVSDEENMP